MSQFVAPGIGGGTEYAALLNFDGDAFDEGLRPFLKDNIRPLTVGDLLETL